MSCPTDIASKAYVDAQIQRAIIASNEYTNKEITKLRELLLKELQSYVKLSNTNWWSENMDKYALPVGGSVAMLGIVGGVPMLEQKITQTSKTAKQALDYAEPALKLAEEIDNSKLPQVKSSVANLQNAIKETNELAKQAYNKGLDAYYEAIASGKSAKEAQAIAQKAEKEALDAFSIAKQSNTKASSALSKSDDALKTGNKALSKSDDALQVAKKTSKLAEDAWSLAKKVPYLESLIKGTGRIAGQALKLAGIAMSWVDLIWQIINQGTMEEMSKRIDRLENYVFDRITNDIVNILGKIIGLQRKFAQLESFVRGKISELASKFPPIENALKTLSNEVGQLKGEVSTLDNKIDYQAIINEKQNVDIAKASSEAHLAQTLALNAFTLISSFAWVNNLNLKGLHNQVKNNTNNIAGNSNKINDLTRKVNPLTNLHFPTNPHMNQATKGGVNVDRIIEKQPIIYNNYITNNTKVVTVPTPAWKPIPNLQPREVRSYIPIVTEKVVTVPQKQVVQVLDPTVKPIVSNIRNQTAVISGQVASIGATTRTNLMQSKANFEILNIVNAKVTAMLGMLTTFVTTTWGKFVNSRLVDKAINLMNLALNIQNAAMLSSNLGETFLYMFSNVLSVFGIKDDDGNPFDFATIIGQQVESILITILGEETYLNANRQFNSLNRIYQAGMNTIMTISNIIDSSRNILETVGEYVGKIGNALRRSGEVAENAYQPMQEKFDKISNDKWENLFEKVEDFEDKLSAVDMVASDIVSIQESVNQFKANKEEFNQAIRTYQTEQTSASVSEPHNVPESVSELEIDAKLNSEAPVDLEKARF